MKYIALALLLGTLCCAQTFPPAAPLTPTQQTLTDNTKSFAEALKTKNSDFVKRAVAPDFSIVFSDGHLYRGGDLVEITQEGGFLEYMPYNIRVLSIDDNSAIATYDCIIKMPEGDDGMAPRYQHISDLWIKVNGEWKLRFEQATPLRSID